MSRLIDADALMADCQLAQKQADRHGREYANAFYSGGGEISTEWWCVEDMIENAPTIEPDRKNGYRDGYKRGKRAGYKKGRERNRGSGEWTERRVIEDAKIDVWQYERCSVCDKYHTTPYLYSITDYAYCPHCGAKMEKGGSE